MERPRRLLIIDDEAAICFAFRRHFERRGYEVAVAGTLAAGLAACAQPPPDIVFLDVRLPDGDGLDALPRVRQAAGAPVIVITAFGTLDAAMRAVGGQARDLLVKPIDLDEAERLCREILDAPAPPAPPPAPGSDEPAASALFIGDSPRMQTLYKDLALAAASTGAVLITGPTGSGKELAARALHEFGPRAGGPFIAVNCGAVPETLVESEFFGYERGAFSGAHARKPGLIECADGGVLFLDEVGELPAAAQAKLLRFLDSHRFTPLGGRSPRAVDVRVLAASNRDLLAAVGAGRFRKDLYFRLAAVEIRVPALAEHREDIGPLAAHFLRRTAAGGVTPEALAALSAYDWPGNVRELRGVVQQAAAAAGGGPILARHVTPLLRAAGGAGAEAELGTETDGLRQALERLAVAAQWEQPGVFPRAMAMVEDFFVEKALRECHGNRSAAAERLGVHRNTLRRKLAD